MKKFMLSFVGKHLYLIFYLFVSCLLNNYFIFFSLKKIKLMNFETIRKLINRCHYFWNLFDSLLVLLTLLLLNLIIAKFIFYVKYSSCFPFEESIVDKFSIISCWSDNLLEKFLSVSSILSKFSFRFSCKLIILSSFKINF